MRLFFDMAIHPPDPTTLTDAQLADRLAYLRAVPDSDELGDDTLTAAGWAELHALEAEHERRAAICPCCRNPRTAVAPGTICANCAAFPLD